MKLLYFLPLILFSVIPSVYAEVDSMILTGDTITSGFYTSLDIFYEDGVYDGDFTIVDMSTWEFQSFPLESITADEDGNLFFTSNLDGTRSLDGVMLFFNNDDIFAGVTITTHDYQYVLGYTVESFIDKDLH